MLLKLQLKILGEENKNLDKEILQGFDTFNSPTADLVLCRGFTGTVR